MAETLLDIAIRIIIGNLVLGAWLGPSIGQSGRAAEAATCPAAVRSFQRRVA